MYSQEVADAICDLMAEGESLRSICRRNDMPGLSTVMRWADENPVFREQYARAINMRADAKFEELDDVSDDAVASESAVKVQGLRLKADNIKWQLARMNAKKYGDKADVNLTGEIGVRTIERRIIDPSA
jgi:hypothetical protein